MAFKLYRRRETARNILQREHRLQPDLHRPERCRLTEFDERLLEPHRQRQRRDRDGHWARGDDAGAGGREVVSPAPRRVDVHDPGRGVADEDASARLVGDSHALGVGDVPTERNGLPYVDGRRAGREERRRRRCRGWCRGEGRWASRGRRRLRGGESGSRPRRGYVRRERIEVGRARRRELPDALTPRAKRDVIEIVVLVVLRADGQRPLAVVEGGEPWFCVRATPRVCVSFDEALPEKTL